MTNNDYEQIENLFLGASENFKTKLLTEVNNNFMDFASSISDGSKVHVSDDTKAAAQLLMTLGQALSMMDNMGLSIASTNDEVSIKGNL